VYSGDRLALCVGETERALREGSKSVNPTDRQKVNVFSCVARDILLLQSCDKLSPEERDCIEETIEIILSDLQEIQVRL
jgi:hypothetical protein